MNRKRRYIIVGVISVVLIALIVVCSTVFTVKDVRINFLEVTSNLTEDTVYTQIVNSNSVKFGSSVFVYDKDEGVKQIEKNVPYLKVVNLEIEFPNILTINCVERRECVYFAITNSISMFAICDKDGKVLRTSNNEVSNLTKLDMINPISNVTVGTFINEDIVNKSLNLFEQFEYISTLGATANIFFQSIAVEERYSISEGVYDIKCITRDNVTVNFVKANDGLVNKLTKFLEVYSYDGVGSQISAGAIVDIYVDDKGNTIANVTN